MATTIRTYRHDPDVATDPSGTLVDTEVDADDLPGSVSVDTGAFAAGGYEFTVTQQPDGYGESAHSNAIARTFEEASTDIVVTVGPTGDYATLQAAITAMAAAHPDLSALAGIIKIELQAFEDTTAATVTGFSNASAAHYISIYPQAGARHAGVWDATKYRRRVSGANGLTLSTPYTRVSGLQAEPLGDVGDIGAIVLNAGYVRVSNSIAREVSGTDYYTYSGFIVSAIGADPCYIVNCLAYGFNRQDTGNGFNFDPSGAGRTYAYNCTAVDCTIGFNAVGYRNYTLKNCLASGCASALNDSGDSDWAGSGYCATSLSAMDPSPAASNPFPNGTTLAGMRYSQTFTFVDAAAKNYALAGGDAGALGFGTNLAADADMPFTDNLAGATRVGNWNIGAL